MRVKKINLYKFCLQLKKELEIKKHRIDKREGIIIKISYPDDSTALGEISPLAGFHHEDLSEAVSDLKRLSSILPQKNISDILNLKMAPSVRYGFEMAQMNLSFLKISQSLKKSRDTFIPVCALVYAASENIATDIKQIIKQGYKSIKVKVGHLSLDDDIERINHISDLISDEKAEIGLRIDPNASWDLEDAIRFALGIEKRYVQYIEDPVDKTKDYQDFFKATGMPVALDEKLEDFEREYGLHDDNEFIKAVVLKPNYIGGFSKTSEIIERYKKRGADCVLSNSFESGLSVSAIILFAYKMGLKDIAIGIDTLKYFKNDILKNSISIKDALIDVSLVSLDEANVDFSDMEKIS